MKLIRPFLGRREFLIGSIASASTLSFKQLTTGNSVAMAFDDNASVSPKAGVGGMKEGTGKFSHLFSPLIVRNRVLKNRIMHTPSPPHSLQGPENYPADPYRAHYSEMAKNAAIVSIVEEYGQWPKTYSPTDTSFGPAHYSDSMWEDIPPVRNYVDQMVEEVHCEGALVCCGSLGGRVPGEGKSFSTEDIVTQAKQYEDKGYDAVDVGFRSFTDREAVRPVIEQLQAVRKATNLIIIAVIAPFTPGLSRGNASAGVGVPSGDMASGPELEEVVVMAKMLEGSADILRMKDTGHYTNHPNSFTMEKKKPWMLRFSQAIKESGNRIVVCPTGGFHDPALNEEWLVGGKMDMVGMATPLFADPEYIQKAYEGRAEDIVPCVMCHDCHGVSRTEGPWFDVCTVNPKWGLSETKKRSIRPPVSVKKVAVIGGGPAGMKAAITAAERGHKVTLYEKDDALGGLLRHTDHTQWKWTYRDFKDYLVRQVNKAGIEVKLNTAAAQDMIKTKRYDAVLVATGAAPVISSIPGADGKNVFNIMEAYTNMKSLGKNVVILGAGVFGTETGICLAKDGYKVTVLASGKEMIEAKYIGPHNKENQIDIYQNHPNFSYVLGSVVTRISEGKVIYKDSTGIEKSVLADSVVIYGGLKPRMDEAMKFSGSAGQVLFLGDCTGKAGTVQKTIRSAFFMASQV